MAERHWVVVIQSDRLNQLKNYPLVTVIPFTSQTRDPLPPSHVQVDEGDYASLDKAHEHAPKKAGYAKCEQVLLIEQSNFKTPVVGKLTKEKTFEIAERAAFFALGFSK